MDEENGRRDVAVRRKEKRRQRLETASRVQQQRPETRDSADRSPVFKGSSQAVCVSRITLQYCAACCCWFCCLSLFRGEAPNSRGSYQLSLLGPPLTSAAWLNEAQTGRGWEQRPSPPKKNPLHTGQNLAAAMCPMLWGTLCRSPIHSSTNFRKLRWSLALRRCYSTSALLQAHAHGCPDV